MQRTDTQLRLDDWAGACAAKQRPSPADVMPAVRGTAEQRKLRRRILDLALRLKNRDRIRVQKRAAYHRIKNTGIRLLPQKKPARTKEFMRAQCDANFKTGCWEWRLAKDGKGYGLIRNNGITTRAHRLSYTLWVGPIRDGLCVLHRCDNPPCINPEHLFLGTIADNTKDAALKCRMKSKLTNEQVLKIRHDPRTGKQIGKEFGVSYVTVNEIKRFRQRFYAEEIAASCA